MPAPYSTDLRERVLAACDEAENARYDSDSMRRFAGIELREHPIPDESSILRLRHLLERHGLTERLFAEVRALREKAACCRRPERSSMSPSSRPRLRLGMPIGRAILIGARPRRASSDASVEAAHRRRHPRHRAQLDLHLCGANRYYATARFVCCMGTRRCGMAFVLDGANAIDDAPNRRACAIG